MMNRIFGAFSFLLAIHSGIILCYALFLLMDGEAISWLERLLDPATFCLNVIAFLVLILAGMKKSRVSILALSLSFLYLSGSMVGTPFVFMILKDIPLSQFVYEMGNFSFLLKNGFFYRGYFFVSTFILLALSISIMFKLGLDFLLWRPRQERVPAQYLTSLASFSVITLGFGLTVFIYLVPTLTIFLGQVGLNVDQGRLEGIEKIYQKDDVTIALVPMAHIADESFYRGIVKDYQDQEGVMLQEGVKDENRLLKKGKLFYEKLASPLKLAKQSQVFLFPNDSRFRVEWADVDASEFAPATITFLNHLVMNDKEGEGSPLELLMKLRLKLPNQIALGAIMRDMLDLRNQRLFEHVEKEITQSKLLLIPWGAAHIPDIEKKIIQLGFKKTSERPRLLGQSLFGRLPASGP